jgi:predicted permease
MWVFSPALLVSTYGTRLTPALLERTLTMGAWCCIHVAVCVAVGWLTQPLAAPSARLAGVYRAALIFGNSASLPFLLLSTLVQRAALRADEGAFERGIVYCFSYMIPWFVAMYSLGFELLSAKDCAGGAGPAAAAAATAPPPPPAPALDVRAVLQRTLQQPPILATLVGVLVGLTPLKTLFWGAAPPLEGLGAVATLLGQGSIASANIVLAGSLFSAVVELRSETLAWMGEGAPPEGASGGAVLAASASLFARALRRRLGGSSSSSSSSSGRVQLREEEEEAAEGSEAAAEAAAGAAAEAGAAGGGKEGGGSGGAFFSVRTTGVLIASRLLLCPALCYALFMPRWPGLCQCWPPLTPC